MAVNFFVMLGVMDAQVSNNFKSGVSIEKYTTRKNGMFAGRTEIDYSGFYGAKVDEILKQAGVQNETMKADAREIVRILSPQNSWVSGEELDRLKTIVSNYADPRSKKYSLENLRAIVLAVNHAVFDGNLYGFYNAVKNITTFDQGGKKFILETANKAFPREIQEQILKGTYKHTAGSLSVKEKENTGNVEGVAGKDGTDAKKSSEGNTRQSKTFDNLTDVIEGKTYLKPGDSGKGVKDFKIAANGLLVANGKEPVFDISTDTFTEQDVENTKKVQALLGMDPQTGDLITDPSKLDTLGLLQDGKPGTRTTRALMLFYKGMTDDQKAKIDAASKDNEKKTKVHDLTSLTNDKNLFIDNSLILNIDKFKEVTGGKWTAGNYTEDLGRVEAEKKIQALNKAFDEYKKIYSDTKLTPDDVLEVVKKIDATKDDQRNNKKGILFFSAEQWKANGLKEDSSPDEQYAKFISILGGLKKNNPTANADALFKAYFEEAEVKK